MTRWFSAFVLGLGLIVIDLVALFSFLPFILNLAIPLIITTSLVFVSFVFIGFINVMVFEFLKKEVTALMKAEAEAKSETTETK